jgi:hypothetical protein
MKRVALKCLASALITVSGLAQAQEFHVEKPAPEFTLKIREVGYGGTLPGNYAVLVTEKNISATEIWGRGCTGFWDWLDLIILYNGVSMPETDAVRRLKKVRQVGGPCGGDFGDWKIGHGEEHQYQFNITQLYDMHQPGIYQITVTKETAPNDPVMSTTVKSNTIIIVVP